MNTENDIEKEDFEVCDKQTEGWFEGTYYASYEDLFAILGEPSKGDSYKVSTEWIIRDNNNGDVWSLYDYKETNRYDLSLPSVESFRKKSSHGWHIGGTSSRFQDLIAWLNSKINELNK